MSRLNDRKKPKKYPMIGQIIFISFFSAYSLFNSLSANKTPTYVKSAASDLETGLTAQLGVAIRCLKLKKNNSWLIGCKLKSEGDSIYLFKVTDNPDNNPNHLSYKAYAINDKAIDMINASKMTMYQIQRLDKTYPANNTSKINEYLIKRSDKTYPVSRLEDYFK